MHAGFINSASTLLIVAMVSACSYVPFSGGSLDGVPTEALTDWRTLAEIDIIQLETRPEDPYSVKLWVIAQEHHLYVYAGDNYSQWAQNIDANPKVRLQADNALFALDAARVTNQDEFRAFADTWLDKYGSDRREANVADVYLYRLVEAGNLGQ